MRNCVAQSKKERRATPNRRVSFSIFLASTERAERGRLLA